jgi:hypothetical protein
VTVLRKGGDSYNLPAPGRVPWASFWSVYLGGAPGKDGTVAGITAFHNAGKDILLNYENSGADATTGFEGGVRSATIANQQADARGAPGTVGIYYSADAALPVSVVVPYFQGVASVRNGRPRGAYGGTELLVPLQQGLISWWWQSMSGSWSGWRSPPGDSFPTDPRAAIRQRYISASFYDEDDQMMADCGLWLSPSSPQIIVPSDPTVFTDSCQEVGPVAVCTYPKDPTRKDQLVLAATGVLYHSASIDTDAELIHPVEWALNGLPPGTSIAKVSYCVWKGDGSGMWAQIVDTTGQAWESLMSFNGAFSPWTPATGVPLLKV